MVSPAPRFNFKFDNEKAYQPAYYPSANSQPLAASVVASSEPKLSIDQRFAAFTQAIAQRLATSPSDPSVVQGLCTQWKTLASEVGDTTQWSLAEGISALASGKFEAAKAELAKIRRSHPLADQLLTGINEYEATARRSDAVKLFLAVYQSRHSESDNKNPPAVFHRLTDALAEGRSLKAAWENLPAELQNELDEGLGGSGVRQYILALPWETGLNLRQELFALANNLSLDDRINEAVVIYGVVADGENLGAYNLDKNSHLQHQAQCQVGAITGEGPCVRGVDAFVFQGTRFFSSATSLESILSFGGAFVVGRMIKSVAMARYLSQAPKLVLSSLPIYSNRGSWALTKVGAGVILGETAVMTGLGTYFQHHRGLPITLEGVGKMAGANLLTFGLLHGSGMSASYAHSRLHNVTGLGVAQRFISASTYSQQALRPALGVAAFTVAPQLEYVVHLRDKPLPWQAAIPQGFFGYATPMVASKGLNIVWGRSGQQAFAKMETQAHIAGRIIRNPSLARLWDHTGRNWQNFFPNLSWDQQVGLMGPRLAFAANVDPAVLGPRGRAGDYGERRPWWNSLLFKIAIPGLGEKDGTYVSERQYPDVRRRKDETKTMVLPRPLDKKKISYALTDSLTEALRTVSGIQDELDVRDIPLDHFGASLGRVFTENQNDILSYQRGGVTPKNASAEQVDRIKLVAEIIGFVEYFRWSAQSPLIDGFFGESGAEKGSYESVKEYVANFFRPNLEQSPSEVRQTDVVPYTQGALSIGNGAMLGLLAALRYKIKPGPANLPFWYGLFTIGRDAREVAAINQQGKKLADKGGMLVNASHEAPVVAFQAESQQAEVLRRTMQLQWLNIPSSALPSVVTHDYIRNLPQHAILGCPIKGVVGLTRDRGTGQLRPLTRAELEDPNVEIVATYRPDQYIEKVIREVNVQRVGEMEGELVAAKNLLRSFFETLNLSEYQDVTAVGSSVDPVERFLQIPRSERNFLIGRYRKRASDTASVDAVRRIHELDHIDIVPVEGFYPQDLLFNGGGVTLTFYGPKEADQAARNLLKLYKSDYVQVATSDRMESGVWGGIYKNVATLDMGYQAGRLAFANLAPTVGSPVDLGYEISKIYSDRLKDMGQMVVVNEGARAAAQGVVFDQPVEADMRYCSSFNVKTLAEIAQAANAFGANSLTPDQARNFLTTRVLKSDVASTRNPKRGLMQAIIEHWNQKRALTEAGSGAADILPQEMRTIEGEITLPVLVARAHAQAHADQRRLPNFVYDSLKVFYPARYARIAPNLPAEVKLALREALYTDTVVNGNRIDSRDLRRAIDRADNTTIEILNNLFEGLAGLYTGVDRTPTTERPYVLQIEQINGMIKMVNQGRLPGAPIMMVDLDAMPFLNAYTIPFYDAGRVRIIGAYTYVKMTPEKAPQGLLRLGNLFRHYNTYQRSEVVVDLEISEPISIGTANDYSNAIEKTVQSFSELYGNHYTINFKTRVTEPPTEEQPTPEINHYERNLEKLAYTRESSGGFSMGFMSEVRQNFGLTPASVNGRAASTGRLLAPLFRDPNVQRLWTRLLIHQPKITVFTAIQAAMSRPENGLLLGDYDASGQLVNAYVLYDHRGQAYVSNPFIDPSNAPNLYNLSRGTSFKSFLADQKIYRKDHTLRILDIKQLPIIDALMGKYERVNPVALLRFLQGDATRVGELNRDLQPFYLEDTPGSKARAQALIKGYLESPPSP
ncbi:MAG: hypothetical protein HYU97_11135 [Deltaproteobacteria bacterium]|nr:hypothetical protein [Deltaproteobacteria bacterium]